MLMFFLGKIAINFKNYMDNYTIGKKISEGAFGTVYSAASNLLPNTSLAIKQIYKSPNTERELSILKQLPPHPNLIHIYDIVAQNEVERSIVMERGLHDLHSLI
jgi:serine/threonine protein kinase